MRTFILLALVALSLIIIAGCNQAGGGPGNDGPQISISEESRLDFGPEEAKVHLVAYYPLNEKHMKLVDYLKTFVDKYPGQVKLTAWDFRTDEGGEKTKEAFGKICGGMQINGESDFTVEVEGESREVTIMNGEDVYWTRPELEAAMAQAIAAAYPPEAAQ